MALTPAPDHAALETRLGHAFSDRDLLLRALTHMSGADRRLGTYQRLEFLGDRVLGLAVSELLYRGFPDAPEGDLSRRLAELVRRETCAEIAEAWDLGPHLRLGPVDADMEAAGLEVRVPVAVPGLGVGGVAVLRGGGGGVGRAGQNGGGQQGDHGGFHVKLFQSTVRLDTSVAL